MKHSASIVRLLPLAAAVACGDILSVKNTNNPDVARVYALPATIEQSLGSAMSLCFRGWNGGGINIQLMSMSLESYAQLNNFSMTVRNAIPRSPLTNVRGAPGTGEPVVEFGRFSQASRTATNSIAALDRLVKSNGTLGSPVRNAVARSFGFAGAACDLGNLALTFDSAAIVDPSLGSSDVPPLSGYQDVMTAALKMLDTAITIANSPDAANGFTIPANFMSGTQMDKATWIKMLRQMKARFRAEVARTPAERAAVNWDEVIADANAGLTAPLAVTVSANAWTQGFQIGQAFVQGWSQISPFYWGFADVSGGFKNWLQTGLTSRNGYFLIETPDRRWPQGSTRAAQQAASNTSTSFTALPYISNRTTQDTPGDPWGVSFYEFHRLRYFVPAGSQGQYPFMLPDEANLLAAEGYIRKGQLAQAAAKIDISRTRSGLPALAGVVNSLTDPVPGGAQCVPQVPVGPSFTNTACGNILEAMKYEKRMELAMVRYGSWYFDMRGWGDLIQDTGTQFPVPFAELDARGKPTYSYGGGLAFSAPKGTYGF